MDLFRVLLAVGLGVFVLADLVSSVTARIAVTVVSAACFVLAALVAGGAF
jgi:cytochrome c oxidase assembly factor CtaG